MQSQPRSEPLSFYATSPREMGQLLAEELRELGAESTTSERAGASFRGSLEVAYRACLWSRVAGRVLLALSSFPAREAEEIYQGASAVPWLDHLGPQSTFAVTCVASRPPPWLANSLYAALKVKDAVVDQVRSKTGTRPSVDADRPDLRIHLRISGEEARLYLDLSGESLHRRGYRTEGGRAPLKENLAAGLLLLAGWPERSREGAPFLDPMCGSGTLPLEAALMALKRAPGLKRTYFGFLGWRGHQVELWDELLADARERARSAKRGGSSVVGYDADPEAVRTALTNLERAGLRGMVHLERRPLSSVVPPARGSDAPRGLIMMNPPYGHRLGEEEALIPLYTSLGDFLKRRFGGWDAYLLTGNAELSRYLGLRAVRRHVVFNGTIECRLLHYPITARAEERTPTAAGIKEHQPAATHAEEPSLPSAPGIEMFSNRLRKNLRHLRRWAKRERISCYRLYDADLPEYAVAIDLYDRWVHVQEYAPPKTVDATAAKTRLRQILSVLPELLEVSPADVFLKVRRRQRGRSQYEKVQSSGSLHEVREGGHRFLVNLTDYLDTGLFLDHRLTRALIAELAPGRSFLNLFCYTGAATVYAAKAGASSTVSIDLSTTYLDWARQNFKLNGVIGPRQRLVRADCLEWIKSQRERYGLIFLDPPTFSNSKSMTGTLDVVRDHAWLLRATAKLLEPGGLLIFSTNAHRFALDTAALEGLAIEDITHATIPPDFARNPRIHSAFKIWRG